MGRLQKIDSGEGRQNPSRGSSCPARPVHMLRNGVAGSEGGCNRKAPTLAWSRSTTMETSVYWSFAFSHNGGNLPSLLQGRRCVNLGHTIGRKRGMLVERLLEHQSAESENISLACSPYVRATSTHVACNIGRSCPTNSQVQIRLERVLSEAGGRRLVEEMNCIGWTDSQLDPNTGSSNHGFSAARRSETSNRPQFMYVFSSLFKFVCIQFFFSIVPSFLLFLINSLRFSLCSY